MSFGPLLMVLLSIVIGTVSAAKPLADEITTTAPEIALDNLHAQIVGLERSLRGRPANAAVLASLIGQLLLRTRILGSYRADFAQALKLSKASLDLPFSGFEAHLLRANVLAATHQFAEAVKHLDRAVSMGAPAQQIDEIRASIAVARGESLDDILLRQRIALDKYPSFAASMDLAITEATLGNFNRADELYARAISLYRDTSPFPLALVAFQRGVMWCEMAGDCLRAEGFYREAVKRVPAFVSANVHLAEIEFKSGRVAEAIHRLESVAQVGSDPEPAALLAKIFVSKNSTDEAKRWLKLAKREYNILLAQHEEAFRDHGAEFFLGVGQDPQRALQLAMANLEERKDERAYLLAIRALEANGQLLGACKLIAQVRNRNPVTVPLIEEIRALAPACIDRGWMSEFTHIPGTAAAYDGSRRPIPVGIRFPGCLAELQSSPYLIHNELT